MIIERKIRMIKYWIKLLRLRYNSLLKLIYMKQKVDLESNINYNGLNWAETIKQILHEIGMAELWLSQNITNILIHHTKERIIDIYHQTWKTDCQHIVGTKANSHNRYILIKYICTYTQMQNSSYTIQSFITWLTHRKRQTLQH